MSWNCRTLLLHWIFETRYETKLMEKYDYLETLLIYLKSATKFPQIRNIEKVALGIFPLLEKKKSSKERFLKMRHKKVNKEVIEYHFME